MHDVLAQIEAFLPSAGDDNWRLLDDYVQSLVGQDLRPALPTLLRVFERFPRHDGHGVFWGILHVIETIPGYEPVLADHVRRTPTEMGITMLQRIGTPEMQALATELAPRAPVIDYTVERRASPSPADKPDTRRTSLANKPDARRTSHSLADQLDALRADGIDWSAARALVDEALAGPLAPVLGALLRVLDRFHEVDGNPLWWPIISGVEAKADFPSLLVAHLQTARSRNGLTLLLRLLGLRQMTTIDGVDVAAFAAELMQ